jgi:hypothetical protein
MMMMMMVLEKHFHHILRCISFIIIFFVLDYL